MSEWLPFWIVLIFGNLAAFILASRPGRRILTPAQLRTAWMATGLLTVVVVSSGIVVLLSPRSPAAPLSAAPAPMVQPGAAPVIR